VALLTITERQVTASRSHIPVNRMPRKSFPTTPKTLGDRIQIRRVEMKLSQAELASKIGITKLILRLWESDSQAPKGQEWQKLEALLGIDANVKTRTLNT
jgi:ribosome-binding protein aMBF1 (putative translation factor)